MTSRRMYIEANEGFLNIIDQSYVMIDAAIDRSCFLVDSEFVHTLDSTLHEDASK